MNRRWRRIRAATILILGAVLVSLLPSAGEAQMRLRRNFGKKEQFTCASNPQRCASSSISRARGRLPQIYRHDRKLGSRIESQLNRLQSDLNKLNSLAGNGSGFYTIDPFGDYLFHGVPIRPKDGELVTRHLDPEGFAARAEEWAQELDRISRELETRQGEERQKFIDELSEKLELAGLDPKHQLQLSDLSGGQKLEPESLGEELSLAGLPELEGDTPALLRDPFGNDDPTMSPTPAAEKPGIDQISVPPPMILGSAGGCGGFACAGIDPSPGLSEEIGMWLADPVHREWLGDAFMIATAPAMIETALPKASRPLFSVAGIDDGAGLWHNHFPGVQVRRFGDWWVKRVNPEANPLMQWWGQQSINGQYEGLQALEGMATSNYLRHGILFTKDVGPTLSGGFRLLNPTARNAYIEGSRRMGTWFNDIRPANMGANGLIFDPAIDPVTKTLFWTDIAGGAGTAYGIDK